MKLWELYMIASWVFFAPHTSPQLGRAVSQGCLILATISFFLSYFKVF